MWICPRVTEFKRCIELECLGCGWVVQWANLLWSYCILPNAHSDKWSTHTSNYEVTHCITASSIESMYGYSAVGDSVCWSYIIDSVDMWIFVQCQTCFIFIMASVYVFEWFSCRLVWNIFGMACFVEVRVYKIAVNCIWTIELWNDKQMKTISNFGMGSAFEIFVTRN